MPRLPAEWEPQDAVLLAWPHAATDWGPSLERVEATYRELVRVIATYEPVLITAHDPGATRAQLAVAGVPEERARVVAFTGNDTWVRDCGPITVEHAGEPLLLDFAFNGWGLKFPADRDNQLTRSLAAQGVWGAPVETVGLVLEGGSIDGDGRGTVLTTSRCLLEANRNPHLDRAALERELARWLGAQRILWLDHGELAGDDTDGHVDTVARLAPTDTILHVTCDDPDDPQRAELDALAAQLATLRTAAGLPYRLLALPWPRPVVDAAGHRLPATYANFLVVNGAVLVPTYADPADGRALEVVAAAFPGRRVVGVDCRTLLEQHGSLHCITMHLPRGVLS